MKNTRYPLTAAALAALLVGTTASGAPAGRAAKDSALPTGASASESEPSDAATTPPAAGSELADRVFAELVDRSPDNADLDVSAIAGVVTLAGTVPSERAKQRAIRTARRTPGVTQVRDHLEVQARTTASSTPPPDAELARAVAKAAAAEIPGAKAGEDWWFTGWRVEGPQNRWNFVVEADRGNVTLEGDVPRASIVTAAVRAAREVADVRTVDSQLELPVYYGWPAYPAYGYGYYAPYPSSYAYHAPYAHGTSMPDVTPSATAQSDAAAETATVRGKVTRIDEAKETLTVETQGGPVTLPLPDAGAGDLAAGDRVQVEVAIREQPRRSE